MTLAVPDAPHRGVHDASMAQRMERGRMPKTLSGLLYWYITAIREETPDRLHIMVASLGDVIRSKEAAGREKDRLALPRLRRLLDRLRDAT